MKKYVHRETRQPLAVKIIPIPVNSKLKSAYAIRFYGFCIYEGAVHICMEYMDMALNDLYPQIHTLYGAFPERLLGWIAVSVVNAVCDLLLFNVIHCDINPHNIMINKDGEVKICGFSEFVVLEKDVATIFVGTLQYSPPERLLYNENYGPLPELASMIQLSCVASSMLPLPEYPKPSNPIVQFRRTSWLLQN
uniref:mitogen-activated protein kinase kinase n=1 Tax=Acrobeloides nanus TaxID=290746 RepID=A0A914D2C6_9BILA